ncbi:hypothetical protein [Psychrobacter sp. 72-O-c]|nr:hypothetical protein [Psychrobacter sp. 72-O-c]
MYLLTSLQKTSLPLGSEVFYWLLLGNVWRLVFDPDSDNVPL